MVTSLEYLKSFKAFNTWILVLDEYPSRTREESDWLRRSYGDLLHVWTNNRKGLEIVSADQTALVPVLEGVIKYSKELPHAE